jgi:hypothetical protein
LPTGQRAPGGAVSAGIGNSDQLAALTHNELDTSQIEGIRISHVDLEASPFELAWDVVSHPRGLERDLPVQRTVQARGIYGGER